MKKTCLLLLLSSSLLGAQTPTPRPVEKPKGVHNDQIYPPAPAAAQAISFDGAGFIIQGERRYLASGSIHYPRVPHELWRDRLLRMKRAGFVNVETYAFWNFHEPRENEWNFTGDADIEKFLTTAQDLGLTSIVRVGPYVCAEWESGGWPLWLRFKPAMNPRTTDPEFLKWNNHWYDKILPLVAKHQIHKGGNVILVQLENEHPLGWGVVNDDPYFDHLREQGVKHGLEVPWFFSGLNHGSNPSPGDLDTTTRSNPWMSTEFWPGWFDVYGLISDKKLRAVDKANWTILAHGGGGHNFYMIHGGSNFDAWSDNSTGPSYDYGSGIGQAGDLRPIYYKNKRANLLAQSFPHILSNSTSVLAEHKNDATGPGVDVLGARRGPGGTLLFLANHLSTETTATLASGGSVRLPRFSFAALPRDVVLEKDIRLVSSTLPVLAVARHTDTTTIVFSGQPGETGLITLAVPETKSLPVTVPENSVGETRLESAGRLLRILVLPQDLSLRLWRVGEEGRQWLVVGPEFVQDVMEKDGTPVVTYEHYLNTPSCGRIAVYGARGKSWNFSCPNSGELEKMTAPRLNEWEMLSAATPATPGFDDKTWFTSAQPSQMGADGDIGTHAWYRATVSSPQAGPADINVKGKDFLTIFVNGQLCTDKKVKLQAGPNTVAILATQFGRNKGFAYTKSLDALDPKGVLDDVTVQIAGQKITVSPWKMSGLTRLDGTLWATPTSLPGWKPVAPTGGLPTYYHTTFTTTPPSVTGPGLYPILRLKWTGLSRGKVWVNGHALGYYPERIRVDSLYVPEPWLKAGKNDLVLLDEAGASPSEVKLIVDVASREIQQTGPVLGETVPFTVPQENPPRDLAKMNIGNLALQTAATASSSEASAGFATDGDPDTLWKPAGKIEPGVPNPWLAINLGKALPLGIVEILWDDKSRDYQYLLEGSTDGKTWVKIGDQTTAVPTSPDSPSELSRLNFKGETFQHLRVTMTATRSPGIAELRVFPLK